MSYTIYARKLMGYSQADFAAFIAVNRSAIAMAERRGSLIRAPHSKDLFNVLGPLGRGPRPITDLPELSPDEKKKYLDDLDWAIHRKTQILERTRKQRVEIQERYSETVFYRNRATELLEQDKWNAVEKEFLQKVFKNQDKLLLEKYSRKEDINLFMRERLYETELVELKKIREEIAVM